MSKSKGNIVTDEWVERYTANTHAHPYLMFIGP